MPKFQETQAKTVGLIFNDNNSITVPNYQRNYSWSSNEDDKDGCQICDLWNDLVEKFNDFKKNPKNIESGEYLLGPMVFVEDKEDSRNIEIVDGQQRLATLTILFCAARDIILELNPGTPYSDISIIHQIIQNSHLSGEGQTRTWQSWRLKLNQVDNLKFEKYIQRYLVEDPPIEAIKDKNTDKYYKNSKKIEYFKEEMKSNRNNYSDSEILLFDAYIELSRRISDALILDFVSSLQVGDELDKIKKDAEIEAEKKIKNDPEKFLGLGQQEFFNHIEEGLTVFEKQDWPDDKKAKLNAELVRKNDRKLADGKPTQTFPDFIEGKIKSLKTKNIGGKGSYQTILENETEREETIQTADRKKSHIGTLTAFCAGITEQITNVRIKVKEEEDAYQIFESLNDQGKSLSKSNLIKNLIIKTIDNDASKTIWSKQWDDMITSLTKEGIDADKFLRTSLLSRGFANPDTGKQHFGEFPMVNAAPGKFTKVTTNNFYRIIKAKITSEAYAIDYIENLMKDAEIIIQFNSPQKEFPKSTPDHINQNRDSKPAIIDMAYLDAEYFQIPILCAYRKWKYDSDEFILLAKVLISFFFRYKIVSKLTVSNIEKIAFVACDIIANGEVRNQQKDLFKIIKFVLQYDNSTHFENQFEYRFEPTMNPQNEKFVLKHIESFLKKKTDDTIPIDKVEIEHILPQHPKLNSTDPTENWDEADFFDGYEQGSTGLPKDFSRWYKKLGNLTMLNNIVNKKISNYNFPTKLDHKDDNGDYDGYKSSNLRINEETVCKVQDSSIDRTEWKANDILDRGTYFRKLAMEIWNLPKIVCSITSCAGHDKHHDIKGEIAELDLKKCTVCGGDLTIKWPATSGPEYLSPTNYQT